MINCNLSYIFIIVHFFEMNANFTDIVNLMNNQVFSNGVKVKPSNTHVIETQKPSLSKYYTIWKIKYIEFDFYRII